MNNKKEKELIYGYGSMNIRELKKTIKKYEKWYKDYVTPNKKRLPTYARIRIRVVIDSNENLIVDGKKQIIDTIIGNYTLKEWEKMKEKGFIYMDASKGITIMLKSNKRMIKVYAIDNKYNIKSTILLDGDV